jgi:hypothetical protein
MKQPIWFDQALDATRNNYQRIRVSKHICKLCGTPLHVATEAIIRRKPDPKYPDQYPKRYIATIIPGVYAFCACAQWIGHPDNRSWEKLAEIYHTKIADPQSEKHRRNMLQGYPTTEFIGLAIEGKQSPNPPPGHEGRDFFPFR